MSINSRRVLTRRLVPTQGALQIPREWRTGTPAQRIHARAAKAIGSPARGFLRHSESSLRRLLWVSGTGQKTLTSLVPRWAEKYALVTGTSIDEQARVLSALTLKRGITPVDAYWFNLVNEDRQHLWPYYVYASERHWNLAASEVLLGRGADAMNVINLIQDKSATSNVLKSLHIAVPDAIVLKTGEQVAHSTLRAWLDQWQSLYAKPRSGSRGLGAFRLEPDSDPTRLRVNGTALMLSEAIGQLNDQIRSRDYLIQPLLVTPEFADAHDVATIRVVTRLIGKSAHVFSAILEWPSRFGPHHEFFELDTQGMVGRSVIPAWIPAYDSTRSEPPVPVVNEHPAVQRAAIRAHESIGGVYAIAWDIALSQYGPLFLEGNCGFGLRIPQASFGAFLPEH